MKAGVQRATVACLADLGLAETPERSQVVAHLLSDPAAVLSLLERMTELRSPDLSLVPPIDRLVTERMQDLYGGKVAPELLVKRAKMGDQNRLLLATLLPRVGEPVPLLQLLLANGLANATSRRLRELRWEHGGFDLEVVGTGRNTAYILRSPHPRVDLSASYWLQKNIRDSRLPTSDRLIALLSARLGEAVSIEDFTYVNPRTNARGKGQARVAQYATARRVRALRETGWQVYSGVDKVVEGLASSEYVMLTLERLPEYERIPTKTWTAVLARADNRCEACRWSPEDGASQGRKLLEVHHTQPQRARPDDVHNLSKLQALCNRCHDAVS